MTKTQKLGKDLTMNLPKLEESDWTMYPNGDILRALTAKLRSRRVLTTFSTWDNNTPKPTLDKIRITANESILKEKANTIPTIIGDLLNLTGIKLSAGSQKYFYNNIRCQCQSAKQRRHTVMHLAMAIHAA